MYTSLILCSLRRLSVTVSTCGGAQLLLKGGVKDVVLGTLLDERPIVKRFSKVAAIILAAGGSTRMGQNMEIKQLLPWGEGTLTTRVAEAAMQSESDVI